MHWPALPGTRECRADKHPAGLRSKRCIRRKTVNRVTVRVLRSGSKELQMSKTKQPENKAFNTRALVFTGVLAALVILLQLFLGINIGPVSITLTLVPIVVGSILLGPQYGAALGLIFGIIVSILSITGKDPGGHMVFEANFAIALIMCLLKGAMAGFLPGIIFKAFKNKKAAPYVLAGATVLFLAGGGAVLYNFLKDKSAKTITVTCIIAAVLLALYVLLVALAFKSDDPAVFLASMSAPVANTGIFAIGMLLFFRPVLSAWSGGSNVWIYTLTAFCGINFVLEFMISVVLSPAVSLIVKHVNHSK